MLIASALVVMFGAQRLLGDFALMRQRLQNLETTSISKPLAFPWIIVDGLFRRPTVLQRPKALQYFDRVRYQRLTSLNYNIKLKSYSDNCGRSIRIYWSTYQLQ